MSVWLWRAGLPIWVAPLFLFGSLVTFASLTRIIAEAGLPMVLPRNIPLDFVISLKSVLLKYGGLKAYRAFIPLFYGSILGQFVAGRIWLIVDYFTGMMGNKITMDF